MQSMTDYDPNYVPVKDFYLVGQKCIIFNDRNEILLLKRSAKSGGVGWNLVGGGLEHGEDPVEGIKREIQEETQLEVDDVKPIQVLTFDKTEDSTLLIIYQAKSKPGEVILNWEHDEYKWMTKEEALKEDISQTVKDVLVAS